MRRALVVLVVAALAGAAAPPGAAAQSLSAPMFAGDTSVTGTLTLVSFGAPGAEVRFFERTEPGTRLLGTRVAGPNGATLLHGIRWSCRRLLRRFALAEISPDGSVREDVYDVRTPSCRDRLRVSAPGRVAPGSAARVALRDRWGLGALRARVCVRGPGGAGGCRPVTLGDGVTEAGARLPVGRRGHWRVVVRLAGHRTVRSLGVGVAPRPRPAAPLSRVLATGDSTMAGVESFLADELAGQARVRREVNVATGLTRPGRPSWIERARDQVRRIQPEVTVLSIGAVDGHSLNGVPCCGREWSAEYARRAARMMRIYRGDGSGRVLWLALPAGRDPDFDRVAKAVNAAVATAANGRPWVRQLRLDALFSPDGAFHRHIPYRGRMVNVRSSDGVHLSAAGTRIAARAAANALRAWPGALRPRR